MVGGLLAGKWRLMWFEEFKVEVGENFGKVEKRFYLTFTINTNQERNISTLKPTQAPVYEIPVNNFTPSCTPIN